MSVNLRIDGARISFANGLWTAAAAVEGGAKKFGADFIVGDDAKVLRRTGEAPNFKWVPCTLDEAQKLARLEVFNGDTKKADAWFNALDERQKAVREGDKKLDKAGEVREGYEGFKFIVAKNKSRPPVRLADRSEVTSVDESPINSGDYVNVRLELYAWLKTGQKGLFASLLGTQFAGKGDSMGGGGAKAGADEFDDVAEGADAGDFS